MTPVLKTIPVRVRTLIHSICTLRTRATLPALLSLLLCVPMSINDVWAAPASAPIMASSMPQVMAAASSSSGPGTASGVSSHALSNKGKAGSVSTNAAGGSANTVNAVNTVPPTPGNIAIVPHRDNNASASGADATANNAETGTAAPASPANSASGVMVLPGAAVPSSKVAMLALPDFTSLVKEVGPAVVNIRTTQRVAARRTQVSPSLQNGQGNGQDSGDMADFFRRFFGIPLPPGLMPNDRSRTPGGNTAPPETERDNGLGSGFILSSDGYVMTNAHVVEGADSIYVTLTDRRQYKARLVGMDKMTDVAVLKINATGLPVVVIGDSDKVQVGEWVLAIGSPFGLENTVTAGIVSAKSRYTGEYLPFIQTDVAVNPGNSGGPLINMQGDVIGINSQIYSRTGGFMGISFSIPIDEAIRVANQLKTTGVVTRGRIGVMIGPVTADVAEALGLPRSEGALITSVVPGGPAEQGGILPGDIILNYDGQTIDQFGDLPRLVGGARPGSKVGLTVWRKGQTKALSVIVLAQQIERNAKSAPGDPGQPPRPTNPVGMTVQDLTPEQTRAASGAVGAIVVAVEDPAASAGIQRGDIVQRVADTDVTTAQQFEAAVAPLRVGSLVPLMVRRGETTLFVPVRVGSTRR